MLVLSFGGRAQELNLPNRVFAGLNGFEIRAGHRAPNLFPVVRKIILQDSEPAATPKAVYSGYEHRHRQY